MKMNTGLAEVDRNAIVEGLRPALADTYSLYLKTHNYHWNVTGPMFDSLHRLFMEHYNEMWMAVDLIAERIRSLGHFAPGGYTAFSKLTKIKEDGDVPKAAQMIQNLIEGHETLIQTLRDAFAPAEKASDQATLDLLTQRLQIHEKTVWMLRSMTE